MNKVVGKHRYAHDEWDQNSSEGGDYHYRCPVMACSERPPYDESVALKMP